MMNIGKPHSLSVRGNAEPVRILVIGTRSGIQEIIDRLCVLKFSDHVDWSKIQPHGERGELMAIMTKWRNEE
jgi:hypothetical protein